MKSAILLASPKLRAHLRRVRIQKRLQEFSQLPLSAQDKGYLKLAEIVFSGNDSADLERRHELVE